MNSAPIMNITASDHRIYRSRRIVIKIGSAVLIDKKSGLVRTAWMESLAADVNRLRHAGIEVLIVSSGAVALGCHRLRINHIRSKLKARRPTSAIGQIMLAHAYQEVMFHNGITTAQILLSTDDTEQRRPHLYLRSTINDLLKLGVVPVINENDTVSTTSCSFGDNDRLSARIAQVANADTLIILSDIDGLYTSDPRCNAAARHIPEVKYVTAEIEAMAGNAGSSYTSGGMVTKLAAAKIAAAAGCQTVIANGLEPNPIYRIDSAGSCTWFCEVASSLTTRKRWIASSLDPRGQLILNSGALQALIAGKSLLPAGVIEVIGTFERGDVVTLHAPDRALCGRGLITYASHDAKQIAGLKSREIETTLGYHRSDEIVHRNDLVLNECSIPK
ncbi:glutamate 5-kinase [Candidatus Endolissoclinum faulkneri L2]|uniref:Glutamate 5-kinase n=1 Tax=Candidatus Endolissoclinum faulkneri L2 TaxID=1193729 RepID=K7YHZ1_9PROT|nr:glutamate 5-kinase [Candidatus Endolissoclinum faulkneri]AFX99215.1 glutamate 5-kinase [Candidatus Endolissoclinum faulkneri L2]